MVNEAYPAIQESKPKNIPVREVEKGPDVERHTIPEVLEPHDAFVRCAPESGAYCPLPKRHAAKDFLRGDAQRKALVLVYPKVDR